MVIKMLNYYQNNKNTFILLSHLLIFCLTSFFFLHNDYFLLSDYPDYLARINLYLDLSDADILSEYYYKNMQITPYMAFPVIVSLLKPVVGIYWAGKLFIVFAIFVIITGGIFLNYTLFQRVTPFSLFLHIFIFNHTLSMGFMNFTLGLGLILWGFALWLRYHQHHIKFYGLFALYGLVIFFCHVYCLFLLGILIGLHQLSLTPLYSVKEFFKSSFYATLKVLSFALIPMIITIVIKDSYVKLPIVTGYRSETGCQGILDLLPLTFFTPVVFSQYLKFIAEASCLVFGIAIIFKKIDYKLPFVISILCIISFFVPDYVLGIALVNIRIPALIGLLFSVSVIFKEKEKYIIYYYYFAILISVVSYINNIYMLYSHNSQVQEFIDIIKDDTNLNGKRLLTVNNNNNVHIYHLNSYALIEANMFVPETMTHTPPIRMYQKYANIYGCQSTPISVKELLLSDTEAQKYIHTESQKNSGIFIFHTQEIETKDVPCATNFHWRHWRQDFDYVLWIDFDRKKNKNIPIELEVYKKGSFFTLYKIKNKD